MYTEYLRREGFNVREVGTTDDALPLVPDAAAVITGLMVPGSFDGVELIQRVRSQRSRTPILVVTALAQREAQAYDAGADVVLVKPCFPDTLLRELRKVMAESAS